MQYIFKRTTKAVSLVWVFTLLFQVCFPVVSSALTSGPSQPESQGFQPAGSSNMVDLFSGDFNYDIPLLDLEGYPINISYASNPGMEDEASWVGMGWTLSPGAVDRNMRGLPDDFRGDKISREMNIRENITFGVSGGFRTEVTGVPFSKLGVNASIFFNNKRGPGFEFGLSPSVGVGKTTQGKTAPLSAGLDLSYNSQSGFDVGARLSLDTEVNSQKAKDLELSANIGMNSREGLKDFNFSGGGKKATSKDALPLKLSGGISFGTPTYIPVSDMNMKTRSFNMSVGLGSEFSPVFPNARLGGYFSTQYLAEKDKSQESYGYIHSKEGTENRNNLLDYNQEPTTNAFSEKMIKLPIAYGTADMFSAKGQGLAAQFKATRGDLGIFREAGKHNGSIGLSLGVDVGVGNAAHTEISVNVPWTNLDAGPWDDDNNFKERGAFTEKDFSTLYEPVHFRDAGESNPQSNTTFFNNVGGLNPTHVEVIKSGQKPQATGRLIPHTNLQQLAPIAIANTLKKGERERRKAVFSYLTAAEARKFGLDKTIKSYDNSQNAPICGGNVDVKSRLIWPSHHISEITVTQQGGNRYVYGIPVYNKLQEEYTFSIEDNIPSDENATLASYTGNEMSKSNSAGSDHYFEKKSTPAYATSYLLTGYLSPDYTDLTGDGITDDDAGTAIKFNYSQAGLYNWRVPSGGGIKKGRYNAGVRADAALSANKRDDKVSVVYGQREQWYMHSMESKNYVARFYTSERKDGLGINLDGDINTTGTKLRKLNRIELYSKNELSNPNPVPIKTVHFKYEETEGIFLGVPNHQVTNGGKLTLKKIYFTYGNSLRGEKNAYLFNYFGEGQPTYGYASENMDRWGMYKKWISGYPQNNCFPYAYQPDPLHGLATEAQLNEYASVGNLNQIMLPTGGVINVDYESDSYAYVMDKRAGQYIFVKGFSKEANGTATNNLYSGNDQNYYIHLHLPKPVANTEEFKKLYMEDVKKLYFNCRVRLLQDNSPKEEEKTCEYITGFADYEPNDITITGSNMVAVLKMKSVNGDRGVNLSPIVKAALTTLRSQVPELAYGVQFPVITGAPSVGEMAGILKGFFARGQDLSDLIVGFDKVRTVEGYAKKVDVDTHSWVRLANPTYNKFGGGSRVKKVSIQDKWGEMAGNGHVKARYATTYDYSMPVSEGSSEMISSGVASYEPTTGNDENLWREPLNYPSKNVLLGPKNLLYQVAPVGEPLFPAPIVGYSKVTVRSIPDDENPDVQRTGTGYSVSRFFTAKDFPTRTDYTTMQPAKHKPNPVLRFFKFFSKADLALSQGFLVEVNDMHGKPRSEETYNEAGALITATEYRYKTTTNGRLDNTVNMIAPNGTIAPGTLGVDMDVWQEMNQEASDNWGLGFMAGIDIGFWGIFPAWFPHFIPVVHRDQAILKTAVTTKFIKRFGIIEKVIKTQNGASLTTKNLVYDRETGDPLLTETESEYDGSNVYAFNYPAHWVPAYDGMGQAYKNQDAHFGLVSIGATGVLQSATISNMLNAGDEVIVYKRSPSSSPHANTYHVHKPAGSTATYLMNREGEVLKGTGTFSIGLKVKRTARRNMAAASVGSFQSLNNPVVGNQLVVNTGTKVLQSSANTFSDKWPIPYVINRISCNNDTISHTSAWGILCQLASNDQYWYTQPIEEKTLCDVTNPDLPFNGQPCTGQAFYALQTPQYQNYTEEYSARIGNCEITLRRPDGEKFKLEDLICSATPPCSTACTTPINLTATNTVRGSVLLDWSDVPGATSYTIRYRQVGSSTWTTINNINPSNYTLNGLLACTEYEFQVAANCGTSTSLFSASVLLTTNNGNNCGTPSNLTFAQSNTTPTEGNLSWNTVPGATDYALQWRVEGSSTWNAVTVTTPPYTLTQMPGFLNYEFRVAANCNGNMGCYSSIIDFAFIGNRPAAESSAVSFRLYDEDCVAMELEIECNNCEVVPCSEGDLLTVFDIFNPYHWGVLGNWRSQSTYAFDDKLTRNYTASSTLKDQGYYQSFDPFWEWISGGLINDPTNWVQANQVIKYNKAGSPIEEKDALGKFESALYGYKNALPIARSSNAKHNQVMYEGFDDPSVVPTPPCSYDFCHQAHAPYTKSNPNVVAETTEKAHTGKRSLKIQPGASVSFDLLQEPSNFFAFPIYGSNGEVKLGSSSMGIFQPVSSVPLRYVISAWVYHGPSTCNVELLQSPPQVLSFQGLNPVLENMGKPFGPIIDGWRKIEEVVTMTSGWSGGKIEFVNNFGDDIYLDDIRIHPFDGSMQSFAYDPFTLRLMATLDERNYAIFYEYDDAGILVRTKRETEKGIITVSEDRSFARPNN